MGFGIVALFRNSLISVFDQSLRDSDSTWRIVKFSVKSSSDAASQRSVGKRVKDRWEHFHHSLKMFKYKEREKAHCSPSDSSSRSSPSSLLNSIESFTCKMKRQLAILLLGILSVAAVNAQHYAPAPVPAPYHPPAPVYAAPAYAPPAPVYPVHKKVKVFHKLAAPAPVYAAPAPAYAPAAPAYPVHKKVKIFHKLAPPAPVYAPPAPAPYYPPAPVYPVPKKVYAPVPAYPKKIYEPVVVPVYKKIHKLAAPAPVYAAPAPAYLPPPPPAY